MTRPLRVGLNAIFLEPGMGGLGTYVLELVPALLRVAPELRLTVLANERGRGLLAAQAWAGDVTIDVPPVMTRRGLRAAGELTVLGALASRRFDVLHSAALTAPLATRAANVVVLADTTWLTMPDMGKGQAATVRLWQAAVPIVARRADRVIAISEAGAGPVREHLHMDPARIDVVPLGYSPRPRAAATPEAELREKLQLGDGPIVLNVAMKKVHKNQRRIVQALPRIREAVPGARLVLAGAPTPYEAELAAEARSLGLGDVVTQPGYVDDADLEGLYAAASVFVFPSLNEGFGLPVLEAMGRGLPVVTSDRSALPEVAGDAALLVDPESVEAIAGATIRAIADAPTRERLTAAGRARPAAFTWERAALETVASWERARG
ncbi:MAG TPA: glycosyltransferase family 1 protein [Solirubrobacteraceae bacterium]|nr:glycosyltransferase family 1 protein [Solirubrobacteraceae bacterium]